MQNSPISTSKIMAGLSRLALVSRNKVIVKKRTIALKTTARCSFCEWSIFASWIVSVG